jgi:hypothetical protein
LERPAEERADAPPPFLEKDLMTKTLSIGVVIGMAVLSIGCPGTGGGGNGGDVIVGTEFSADLDGAQEVPPVDTEGSGFGAVTLSEDESEITYLFTATGLSGPVTAAHFHEAAAGVDGDIVIDVGADVSQVNDEVVIEGSAAADAAFVTALRAGNIYINLHTDLNPGGEIRGQVVEVE